MKKIDLNSIKNKALPILIKAGVKRCSIFGSYVRGENRKNSDIDLLVDFPQGKGFFDFVDLQLELEDKLGKKVDLIEYNAIKPRLKQYILNEQMVIL